MTQYLNHSIICCIAAWTVAQLAKLVITLIKDKEIDFGKLVSSGGMPSSHSAMICALTASVFRICGPKSPEFAISLAVAFITMYDAANVRRYSGEHARLLNIIMKDMFEGKELRTKELKELIGHTPVQVYVGAAIGILIGFVIPLM